jgi:iron complex outermembrane receptor protein
MASRLPLALALSGVSLIAMGPALAQQTVTTNTEPAGPRASQVAQATGLEEIVVTARRREEAIQSVPVAITAITGDMIKDQQVFDFYDLQHYVPGLREYAAASRRETDQIGLRSAPSSSTYFAEAPVAITGTMYDLENVQVIKGPQGTLFGGNNTGGAVIIMPKKPNLNALEGTAEAIFGNLKAKDFQGAINLPIVTGKVALRLAGQRIGHEGFTTDVGPDFPGRKYDDKNQWAGRMGLSLAPLEWFDNYTVFSYFERSTHSTGNKMIALNPVGPTVTTFGQRAFDALAFNLSIGKREVAYPRVGGDQIDKVKNWSVVNISQVQPLDWLLVRDIFSYEETRTRFAYQFNGALLQAVGQIAPPSGGWTSSTAGYSNEVNVQANPFGEALRLTGGWYWEHNPGPPEITQAVRSVSFGVVSPNLTEGGYGNKRITNATYGQASFNLGTLLPALDKLNINGGIRRIWQRDTDQVTFGYNINTGACANLPGRFYPNCVRNLPDPPKQRLWNWSYGADWQVDPTLLAYISFRRNNLAGSTVEDPIIPLPQFTNIGAQKFQDFEVGLKKDWDIDGIPARTNIAYYRTNWKNISRSLGVFNPCSNRTGAANRNAGEALMQGIELEGQIRPTQEFTMTLNYGWSAPYYKFYNAIDLTSLNFVCGANASTVSVTWRDIDLKGLGFPGLPKHKVSITGTYTKDLPDNLGAASLSITAFAQGDHWGSSGDTGPYQMQSGYLLMDGRLDWKDVAGYPIDLGLFVRNLFDRTYEQAVQGAVWNAFGYAFLYYNEPRTYGAVLRYRFGG